MWVPWVLHLDFSVLRLLHKHSMFWALVKSHSPLVLPDWRVMCCSIRLTLTHYRFKSEQCSSHTHTENGLLSLCHLNPHYQGPPHDSQNPGPLIPCPPSFLYMYNVPRWSSLAAWAGVLYFLQLAVRAGLGLGTEQLPSLYTASMRQLSDCQGYPRPLSPALLHFPSVVASGI